MTDEVVIDENNFQEYFRPIEDGPPREGEVLAIFRSMAELEDGEIKRDIVRLLSTVELGPKMAIQVMQKLCKADERWATRVVMHICSDLYHGMNIEDVYKKRYEFMVEMKFYTKREHIPDNDKHWSKIDVRNIKEIASLEHNIIDDEKAFEEKN